MKPLRLILLLLAAATCATAQTYRQRGVVRMITTSASSPIIPVAGVKVVVGNTQSKPTSADGTFTMQVAQQFRVNGVAPPDTFLLALPTSGKTYSMSPNDIEVVVTTTAQKQADYKRLYDDLKKKFRQQVRELDDMRQECRDRMEELSETDAEYAGLKSRFDSLQTLYRYYIDNEGRIDGELRRQIAELSITDFQTLDSINQRLYELKSRGEWKSITDLIQTVMHGDVVAYLQEGRNNEQLLDAMLQTARQENDERVRFAKEAISSFVMQHQHDSVACYYKALISVYPDNWTFLNDAGDYEAHLRADYVTALQYHMRALQVCETDSQRAVSYDDIGFVYNREGKYDLALDYCTRALKILRRQYDDVHPSIVGRYNAIGVVLRKQGKYKKALAWHQKALKTFSKMSGEHRTDIAASCYDIALVYDSQGRYALAMQYFERALEAWQQQWGPIHPDVAMVHNSMAAVQDKQGRYELAKEHVALAMDVTRQIFGECHHEMATSYCNLGSIYTHLGNTSAAIEHYNTALKMRRQMYGDTHPDVASCYYSLGEVYRSMDEHNTAREYYRKALAIWQQTLPESHSNVQACKRLAGG